MKRRLLHLAIALFCIVTQAWAVTATQPASGDGSASNPYQISKAEEMLWFAQRVNAGTSNASTCALLTADINLSTVCSATLGNWTPIANEAAGYSNDTGYSGTFDGNNKTISGLYINSASSSNQALFGYAGSKATIKNLTVVADVNGDYQCAAIAAYNYGKISGCTAQGKIVIKGYSGGIAYQNKGTIEYCTNKASVSCSYSSEIGGIVGNNNKTINCCVNKGAITNTGTTHGTAVGGIAGANEDDGNISNSYNLAAVTGKGNVGGVVGYLWRGSVSNCYNIADVTSTEGVGAVTSQSGAIVGYQISGTTITNCHYLSTITLKKDNAATTLVGVGSGQDEANTYSHSADVFKSGIVARQLNGGNGTTEKPLSTWGQTLGTDNYPVFMTADNGNAVCAVSIKDVKTYGNKGEIITLPAATLSCIDEKIYFGDYKDAAGNAFVDHYTITDVDISLSQTLIDMSEHKATDGYYEISTPEQMKWFEYYVNAGTDHASTCARLTADIDLSTVCSATLGSWTPIANGAAGYSNDTGYSGTFDGNNKTISGLYINSASSLYQALFGYAGSKATIKNLTVVADVNGSYQCAAIVAYNYGKISGCTAQGKIVTQGYSGGIVGWNYGTIEYCTNEASVSCSYADQIGGIVGLNHKTINCCVNKGVISNTGTDGTDVGGIAGANDGDGNISNSYNLAAVTGYGYVGGVVGNLWDGSVTNCYNTADVTSTGSTTRVASTPGAIVGSQASGTTITNCHYLSTITLKKDNAATTLVGVGSGTSETNTYSCSADVFKSGIVARQLNGGNGSTEKPLSTWGQTLGTDNYPVFMTANNSNAVYAVSIKGVNKYGNTGTIISIPAATLSFVDEKIYSGDYKDAAGNAFTDHCTITGADVTLSQTLLIDMASHKATDGYYEISTPEQMKWFEYYVNAGTDHASTCARLTADIDLSTVCSATLGNWTPIASAAGYSKDTGYSGTFDGNNKTINGLYIKSASSSNQALFCYVGAAATIKNLTVVVDINVGFNCAAIAAENYGLISGCTAQGKIVCTLYGSGIAFSNVGTIEYCTNEASVSISEADDTYGTGGIVGSNKKTINCCVNKGTISGTGGSGTYVGGIAGYNVVDDSSISNSYNLAAVTGKGFVGGIVGNLWNGSVTNCYNTADVTSTGRVTTKASIAGAIVGSQAYGTTITNCHYLSTITLKKDNAATTLVGVGSGKSETNTYSRSADVFKSGIVARLLNGGDGTTEQPLGTWGQKLGTDNYPVFKTADNGNVVYAATLYNGSSTGTTAYINPDGQTLGGKLTDNQMAVLTDAGIATSTLGTNVITAENTACRIAITDGKDFYIPADVTADAASYTRSAFRDGYHETLCLPFAPATLPADYRFSAYTRKENSTAYFSNVPPLLNAGQAYMMKYTGTTSDEKADVTFENNSGNVTVLASPVSSEFIGSYLTVSTPAATNYILGVYGNAEEFRPASETYHLKAFRAYLNIPVNAKLMNISFDEKITGINAATIRNEDGAYYDLQGIRITSPQKNHIYIHNGKKVIY